MKNLIIALLLLCINLNSDEIKMPKTTNLTFQKECKSCHMAFQPTLLNSNSWIKVMDNLKEHFGTDASLDQQETKIIKDYLVNNSKNNIKNVTNEIYITKLPWFTRQHRRISEKTIAHPSIKTLSNCVACHKNAEKGNYDEDEIKIPGKSWSNR